MTKKKHYEKKCVVCGKMFTVYSSLEKFCSPSCFMTDIKNATVTRKQNPQSYARQRAKNHAKRRDHARCQLREHLPEDLQHDQHKVMPQVHHIIFLSEFGPDRSWNLITLCEKCHKEIAHRFKADWQWKLLEIVNGKNWLPEIEKTDGPWEGFKIPAYVQKLKYLWNEYGNDVNIDVTDD